MQLGEFYGLGIVDDADITELSHNARVPQTGPAFIHCLRLHLWHEIQHFCAHDFEDITLPFFQVWSVTKQEQQKVFFRLLWKSGCFPWPFIAFFFSLLCALL